MKCRTNLLATSTDPIHRITRNTEFLKSIFYTKKWHIILSGNFNRQWAKWLLVRWSLKTVLLHLLHTGTPGRVNTHIAYSFLIYACRLLIARTNHLSTTYTQCRLSRVCSLQEVSSRSIEQAPYSGLITRLQTQ